MLRVMRGVRLGLFWYRSMVTTPGAAMPQIATSEIKKLQIPILSKDEKKQVLLNFNNEIKMYNEINKINTDIKQIHNNFLGKQ